MTPRIAVTTGEPAGIGPDICVTLACGRDDAELVLIGNGALLQQRAADLRVPFDLEPWQATDGPARAGRTSLLDVDLSEPVRPGHLDPRNARYVLETLRAAVDGCRSGRFDAMTTAPVHKGVINDAGLKFSGHTEFLAQQCDVERVVMMLTGGGLRVALATTHLPLRDVAEALTTERLSATLEILVTDLRRRFNIARPRILVCGLNPHAGEGGHLGSEDEAVIKPALTAFDPSRAELVGPLPADTAFTPRALDGADAVLAMYHDQGLPVLKFASFGSAVNVTLGLPIVRTSVDHGTAVDIAGSGLAETGSLGAALALAAQLATR